MRKAISVDWLQLYCDGSEMVPAPGYDYKLAEYSTKTFKKLYFVTLKGEEFATITAEPTSSVIRADAVLVKFKNRLLYSPNYIVQVQVFLEFANLKVRGITRLDIALDFNYFYNSLSPHTFIRRFLKSAYLKNGRGTFQVIGEQKFINDYQYLRFGEKSADVNVYLYNKTKELQSVQDKPYIRQRWAQVGLNTDIPVWRLEVSIKSQAVKYVDLTTGEMSKINWENVENQQYLYDIFYSYISQYFSLKINDGLLNKSRMKDLKLFDDSRAIYKKIKLPDTTGSNQSDKVFIKKLYMLDKEIRGMKNVNEHIRRALIKDYSEAVCLESWLDKKRNAWEKLAVREY